jgi:hypothetical protein
VIARLGRLDMIDHFEQPPFLAVFFILMTVVLIIVVAGIAT